MPPGSSSIFLSADHITVVALTIAGNAFLCLCARRDPGAWWIGRFRVLLAVVLFVNVAATHVYLLATGHWSTSGALNCQLCDAATAAAVFAMFKPTSLAFELTYFWGLGAALQGLITPAITDRFPHPVFVQFFVLHVGLVTSAAFLAFGLRMGPRPRVVVRMVLWTNGCALVAGVASFITGGNYMFLREPPPTGSVLDLLGPWPWYILGGEVVCVLVYALLSVPFIVRGRRPSVRYVP